MHLRLHLCLGSQLRMFDSMSMSMSMSMSRVETVASVSSIVGGMAKRVSGARCVLCVFLRGVRGGSGGIESGYLALRTCFLFLVIG